jgi:hypothetical protein
MNDETGHSASDSTALVQASLAHLADGERVWERLRVTVGPATVKKSVMVIKGFPVGGTGVR